MKAKRKPRANTKDFDIITQCAEKKQQLFKSLRIANKSPTNDTIFINVIHLGTYHIDQSDAKEILKLYYELAKEHNILDNYWFLTSTNKRSGLYLDGDLHAETAPTEDKLWHTAKAFIQAYLTELGECATLVDASNTSFNAYVFCRTEATEIANSNLFRSGLHIYCNGLSFSKEVKKRAFEAMLKNIRFHELNDYLISSVPLEKQLDSGPINGSVTLPLSKKKDGIPYKMMGRLEILVKSSSAGFTVSRISDLKKTDYTFEEFFQSIPSVDNGRIKTVSQYDLEDIPIDDGLSDSFSETYFENLMAQAESEGSEKTMLILSLIKLLPAQEYATEHDKRRWLAHVVYKETDANWSEMILRWYFNSIDNGDKGNEKHIQERLNDAAQYNMPSANLKELERRVRRIDQANANEILQKYQINDVREIIKNSYIPSQSLRRATHKAIATALYHCVGKNYHAIPRGDRMAVNEALNYHYYHYDDSLDFGEAYKKWYPLKSLAPQIHKDIEKYLEPALHELLKYYNNKLKTIEPQFEGPMKKRRNFTANTITALGEESCIKSVISQFAAKVADKSNSMKFAEKLDKDLSYTGCYNGILHANFKTGEVELLDNDNRDIFVSKSLACIYNADLNDNSDAVKELYGYWTDIIPDRELLEFHLFMRSAVILGASGGMHLEIQIGTGADGKTTINNGEDAALGTSRQNGYSTTMPPQILQQSKKSGNAHDGGAADLFGMRKITTLEPREDDRYLDGSAVKYLLSGGEIKIRDVSEKAKVDKIVGLIVLQTNVSLTFRQLNIGNYRRVYIVPFNVKFWDESTKEQYQFMKNAKEGCRAISDVKIRKPAIREAHLYFWIKYFKRFIKEYGGDIGKIRRPAIVANYVRGMKRASNIMTMFIDEKLQFDTQAEPLQLTKVIEAFQNWYQAQNPKNNPYAEHSEMMYLISSSPLQQFIVDDNNNHPNQLELLAIKRDALRLINYRWRKSSSA